MGRRAYAESGVDVEAAEMSVAKMRALAAIGRGFYPEIGPNDFGAILDLPDSMRRPAMVVSTDGVGTKTEIARRLARYDTIGQDLVAMCADDVVCHGAVPTYFLDYIAVGHLDPDRITEIVGGIAEACADLGAALVGGETAEHPGLMADDELDLAGFCLGFVERDEIIDPRNTRAGDVIVGLASSGLHSNGYSLVRQLLDEGKLELSDDLLTPTRLYASAVLDVARELRERKLRLGSFAHITGGGLPRNIARAIDENVGAVVHPSAWPVPDVVARVARAAALPGPEMRATFNGGIGFVIVLESVAAQTALDVLRRNDIDAWVIGDLKRVYELGGERYVEA
jgi:phosphoribosylformylglycinamidine cyclo-ligase